MTETVVVNKRMSKFDVYIGRGSPLGNPYAIGEYGDRDEVIRKYACDLPLRFRTESEFRDAILSCEGERLGCFCKPKACHGDVIKAFLDVRKTQGEKEAFQMMRYWQQEVSSEN